MPALTHIPLGQRIPDTLHGVSLSLPKMRDVIGYEEKNPKTIRHICSGYPRFVQHPLVRRAAEHVARELCAGESQIWLASSHRAAAELLRWLALPAEKARLITHEHLSGVAIAADDNNVAARAKAFLQHTGTQLSSRQAEDYLVRAGQIETAQREVCHDGNAVALIKKTVANAFAPDATPEAPATPVAPGNVFLASSGMNAIYAAFRAVSDMQQTHGRTHWIQLGWLYLDTIAILQKFTAQPGRDYHFVADVTSDAGLAHMRALFEKFRGKIAGVITEVPTNPLIETPNLAAVSALCRAHDALLIADTSVVSPLNIAVFPHADIGVVSLTKYAASDGDVIAGAAVVNPRAPHAAELRMGIAGHVEPLYSRDSARLAAQIGDWPAVTAQINRTSGAVVDFLRDHPAVAEVFWSQRPGSCRDNYLALARAPEAIGGMVSFTLANKSLAQFYDRVRLAKGPSFGMKATLISPFVYLAHYDLVSTAAGQETLRAAGVSPNLLRLCIGCEPAHEIITALGEALG